MIITSMVKGEDRKSIFIESSAFVALNDSSDILHDQADAISESLYNKQVTFLTGTNVLLEVVTLLSQRASHKEAVAFLELIRNSSTTIIHPDEELILKAEELFKQQTSKNVSYSDCVSFAMMRERHVNIVFSFDHGYKKNGFNLIADALKTL